MIKTVSESNFQAEVVKNERPVLVDLWAPWCGPCIAMEPAIKELAAEFEGKVDVAKLNVDDNPAIAQSLDVMSIPTLMLFKGGKPVERIVGLTAKDKLAGVMSAAIA
ncbi:MAG TPA: thioredoxin [Candidatus Saccharimonadia bacterium]|nr:thioredoxin [Candidatus Saccharimonadia bacterium]